jgi:zinc transport system ATP-binding protein
VGKAIVKLEDIWVDYSGMVALSGINLSINQGDFLGIIGPNGGGKTTLIKVILGLIKPGRGKVSVFEKSPEEGRKFIGYVAQQSLSDLSFPISVGEVVLMGRAGKAGLFRRYSKKDKEFALHALKEVEMIEHKGKPIGKLSGGQRQRVFIARALACEPELLLLDEPTASIDSPMQTEFYELLKRLKRQMTIVLVSHDIGAVSIYVDKIACLNQRLFYHDAKEIKPEELEEIYHCPVDLIAHGVPHRILKEHP